ncbi:Hypothetical predicted protein [Olea europaea subsp. europaea]|uniref:Uncharacterized protein n=1 Tax=Olea europaea subsp. europaea TaxID=158383 RepID=A0A8S0SDI8_OLEEU|nr:Hypothetical predicted protein [Olea europaea subsp. europaea]
MKVKMIMRHLLNLKRKKGKKLKKDGLLEDGEEGSLKNKSKVDANKVVSGILLEGDRVQDKKKRRNKKATVELSVSDAGVPDRKNIITNKSKKKSFETVEDGANEYKMASKKRKRLAHDEDGKQSVEEVAVEETKRKKTDGQEEGKDVELQGNGSLNNTGVEKSSEQKSMRKKKAIILSRDRGLDGDADKLKHKLERFKVKTINVGGIVKEEQK